MRTPLRGVAAPAHSLGNGVGTGSAHGAVNGTVNGAVHRALHGAVHGAVLIAPRVVVLFVVLLVALTGCTGEDEPTPRDGAGSAEIRGGGAASIAIDRPPPPPDPGPRPQPLPSDAPTDDPPRFLGFSQVIAGDRRICLAWEPALDDVTPPERIRYRIYASAERQDEAKFARPPAAESAPGQTRLILDGLPNGEPVHLVVRAVDEAGRMDDNEIEWSAIPQPVLYVQANAPSPGDGATPAAPLPSLDAAIDRAIPLGGANIHVAAGIYEESTLLFRGMMVHGGFAPGFPDAFSEPQRHRTVFRAPVEENLFVIPPGDRLCGIDSIELDGGDRTLRGVLADDCEFRISNCEIRGFADKGIKLKSDREPGSIAVGEVLRCSIQENGNEGIQLNGIFDVLVVGCGIRANRRGGIEIEALVAAAEEKARLTIEGCSIAENRAVGILARIVALPGERSSGARVRFTVRSSEIRDNGDTGVGVDVSYPDGADIDLRVRVEQCLVAGNGKSGIRIDGDARGHLQLARNRVIGNRGPAGIHFTGDSEVALLQLQSSALLANEGAGLLVDARGHLSVDHCHFGGNGGPAISRSSPAWLRLEDSLLHGNRGGTTADRIEHCAAAEGELTGPGAPPPLPGAPWMETLPREIRLAADPAGVIATLPAGTVIEWLDDGVPRRVVEIEGGRALDPPVPAHTGPGVPFLFVWGLPAPGAVTRSVIEDWRPGKGSPLRDAGNPGEVESDGSPADIGPAGAFLGGHPGLDRGGPPPPRGIELNTIDPPPGTPVGDLRFECWFTGATVLPGNLRATMEAEGIGAIEPRCETHGDVLTVSAAAEIPPGARIFLTLPAWPNAEGERSQPQDHIFEYRSAARLAPGEPIAALPAEGRIVLPGRRPARFPLSIDPARPLAARLRPIAPAPPAGWRLRVVDAQSGEVLRAPGTEDRLEMVAGDDHEGALRLAIPALPAGSRAALEVVPPPGDAWRDAAARLIVEG